MFIVTNYGEKKSKYIWYIKFYFAYCNRFKTLPFIITQKDRLKCGPYKRNKFNWSLWINYSLIHSKINLNWNLYGKFIYKISLIFNILSIKSIFDKFEMLNKNHFRF